jgi:hypothetical protein
MLFFYLNIDIIIYYMIFFKKILKRWYIRLTNINLSNPKSMSSDHENPIKNK